MRECVGRLNFTRNQWIKHPHTSWGPSILPTITPPSPSPPHPPSPLLPGRIVFLLKLVHEEEEEEDKQPEEVLVVVLMVLWDMALGYVI